MSTTELPARRVTRASVRAANSSLIPSVKPSTPVTPKESAAKRLERFKSAAQKTSPTSIIPEVRTLKKPEPPTIKSRRQPLAPRTNDINKASTTIKERKLSAPDFTKSPKSSIIKPTSKKLETISEADLDKERQKSKVLKDNLKSLQLSFDALSIFLTWYSSRYTTHQNLNLKLENSLEIFQNNFRKKIKDLTCDKNEIRSSIENLNSHFEKSIISLSNNIQNLSKQYSIQIKSITDEYQSEKFKFQSDINELKAIHQLELEELNKKISELESANERSDSTSSGIDPDIDQRRGRVSMRRNRSCASRRHETSSLNIPLDNSLDENCSMMTSSYYADNEISSFKAVLEMKNMELSEFRRKELETEEQISELKNIINSYKNLEHSHEELKFRYRIALEEKSKLEQDIFSIKETSEE